MLREKRGHTVGSGVVKVIELVGESDQSWEDAVQVAVKEASKTLRGITGVEVLNWTGKVDEQGEIVGYRANVQVAFEVET
ncbi:MAG: dodecin domain-containing protein [Firmicutes bacterium]|nr:dodecin domain-containing protein [Bacillota bacterium]